MNRNHPPLNKPSRAPGSTEFLWCAGIEDTFVGQPDERTGRILDEYALTQHYTQWETDLALLASLGISCARYGIPWYRVEPEPGRFDWGWTDRVLDTLINRHRIEPIIDLVHYGTPVWLEGSFFAPDYPARVAAYARAFAERYRGLCYWYTPLNEPRVNAWFAARLGWWPPYRRSANAYVQMLAVLARSIVEIQRAVAEVEPQAVFVHVDASDLYTADSPEAQSEADRRQEGVFAVLDLVQGRVSEDTLLWHWFREHQVSGQALEWFAANTVQPDVIGFNMYPMFSGKRVRRVGNGFQIDNKRCGGVTFAELTRRYAARYGLPVMCTETASDGPPARRIAWITDSVAEVNRLRAEGVPMVGYTYWPLFSLVTWAYRQGTKPPDSYLVHMGLWDLERNPNTDVLDRVPTAAGEAYRNVCAGQVEPLGKEFPGT